MTSERIEPPEDPEDEGMDMEERVVEVDYDHFNGEIPWLREVEPDRWNISDRD